MKITYVAKLFIVFCSQLTVAQTNQITETKENTLSASIKYVNKKNDGSISKEDVKIVFDAYQN